MLKYPWNYLARYETETKTAFQELKWEITIDLFKHYVTQYTSFEIAQSLTQNTF